MGRYSFSATEESRPGRYSFGAPPASAAPPPRELPAYGPWEDVTQFVQRRRKPDGTYETRPKPGSGAGALGINPPGYQEPESASALSILGENLASGVKGGAEFLGRLPAMAADAFIGAPARAVQGMEEQRRRRLLEQTRAIDQAEDPTLSFPAQPRIPQAIETYQELVRGTLESVAEERERLEREAAERGAAGSPVASFLGYAIPQAVGSVVDPVGGLSVRRAGKAIEGALERGGGRAATETAEELAQREILALRDDALARMDSAPVRAVEDLAEPSFPPAQRLPEPPPAAVADRSLPKLMTGRDLVEEEIALQARRRAGAGAERAREVEMGFRATPEEGEELARRSLPIGEEGSSNSAPRTTDTRGQGRRFHGSVGELKGFSKPEDFVGGEGSYYGTGFYTTDAADIAHGYAKRGKLYEISERRPAKIYDMEAPLDPDLAAHVRSLGGDNVFGDVVEGALGMQPRNLRELYDNIRDVSREERLPAYEVQEALFDPIAQHLRSSGFDGMRHVGGLRTKRQPHDVTIYFDPAETVAVRERGAFDDLADEAMASIASGRPPSARRSPDLLEPAPRVPSETIAPPAVKQGQEQLPLRMSTKGIENQTGMQAEFHELVERNRPTIEAARGPVKPASRWHDAQALADDLGMDRDDFLNLPRGRTLGDEEMALGRHYLGGMKQEINGLAKQLAEGDVLPAERGALADRLAQLETDTVRMMANLQGQGSSVAGRTMRQLQEELDPFGLAGDDPRRKLQLGLLKRYQGKNAEQAAAIEAKAISRIQRKAAAETRKAGRVATREELAAEFSALSSEFGKKASTPRTGLDPELVALMGRMAGNRVKAGVVALEQVADEIYQVARNYVEGLTLADVKQAIVQDTMTKPGKKVVNPEDARLRRAEGVMAARVKKLEARVAGGPQLPGKAPAVQSERLSALRQQAADLRGQILKDPRQGLVQRYRELLDDQTVEMIAKLPADPSDPSLLNFIRQMEKPTFRDYRTAYWFNSVLSGTKTTIRNLSGNAARLAELTAMRPAGAIVEQGLARAQGRVAERTLRETVPAMVGIARGVPEGLKRFAFVMRNGYDPGRLVAELTGEGVEKWGASHLPVSPFLLSESPAVRKVGAVVSLPTRLLEATDALAKSMAQMSESYAWATRKAVQEKAPDIGTRVAELILEQPEEMLEAGRAFAKRATYQDPMSWVGTAASAIRRGPPGAEKLAANLRASGGAGNRLLAGAVQLPQTVGEHLVPFIHVSDRVAASITDYIPGSKPFKTAQLLAEKSPEAADLIARQVVGGALGLLGIGWANQGKLVGAAPQDEKLRNDFYAEGKQPYSILIAGRWVPIRDTLGPLAGPFVAAAMYHDHTQVGADPAPAVAGMALGTARYMLDASYLQTLQDVIQAVDEEGGEVGRGLTKAGARVAGGYVPYSGLQRNIATGMDPRVVDKDGFTDELKAGIPGLREQLPSRLDTLGNPLEMSTGAAGGFSPVVPTQNQLADPGMAEEIGRLRYTVENRRRELGRGRAALKDAIKAKDRERVQALRAEMPKPQEFARLDAALKRVRLLENRVRQTRASERLSPDQKRQRELADQARMQQILESALSGLSPER